MSDITAERAAELTAMCSEVTTYGSQWQATLWCSSIGQLVVGKGDTALAAVLDAYRERDSYPASY